MSRVARLLATVGGAGYLPVAPGTWGSAAGVLLVAAVRMGGVPVRLEIAALLVVLAIGVWSAGVTGRLMGDEDPGPVVIDEVVGQWITLLWLPLTWQTVLLGFLLFRVFDIVKPFPARQCEQLPGGWGVMFDDVMAGIYGQLVLRGAVLLLPAWLL